jgi:acyl-CoA synthetase (AMP-forming)/AMP-acid ligase II
LNAVGRPCTLVHVRVVDDDRQDVAPGVLGEVVLRGDHQMVGYLNRPEATAETIRDGWIHTNDLGTVDKEGYVYLTGGRKTDMIITGGLNVFPIEVEQVLYQHPAVSEVCVIGVPHPTWGESIKACVVLRPGQSAGEQELIEFCKDRLASYKKPQSIDFLPELPHNAAGKISYAELRKLYQD